MGSLLDGLDTVLDAADGVVSGLERVLSSTGAAPRRPDHARAATPGARPRSPVEVVVDAQTGQRDYVVRTAEGTVACSSAELASRVRDSLG